MKGEWCFRGNRGRVILLGTMEYLGYAPPPKSMVLRKLIFIIFQVEVVRRFHSITPSPQ